MKDWKIQQELYHRLTPVHDDDLNDKDIVITDNIVTDAVRYFKESNLGWIYPSKSYMVGICYARWLAETVGGDPLDYLNDPDLLYGNDPYFVIYNDAPKIYVDILESIGGWNFDKTTGMVPDVRKYFNEEFMLND
jgi:hypothetical protein